MAASGRPRALRRPGAVVGGGPDGQKAHLAAAVWRLAARSGLGAVSLRTVAAEADVSMGRVQHYFATKDELLLFGLEQAQQRMRERVEQRLAGFGDPSMATVVRETLGELLAGDPDTRQALRVCIAYYDRALDDPRVAELLFGDDPELMAATAAVVRAAVGPQSAVDPQREAVIVWSLAGSLGVEVAMGHLDIEQARETLAYHLARVPGFDSDPS